MKLGLTNTTAQSQHSKDLSDFRKKVVAVW